jgi:hypothetical protein
MTGLTETLQPSRRRIERGPIDLSKKKLTPRGKLQSMIKRCRVQKYERDLKRWEFMEEEQDREQ